MTKLLCLLGRHRWQHDGAAGARTAGRGRDHATCARCGEVRGPGARRPDGWKVYVNPPPM